MHFHAEHSLFFERRQPPWVVALAFALTGSVLIINAGARSTTLSLLGAGVGALLLVHARVRGQRRVEPALEWALALVVLALLAGVALTAHAEVIVATSARVLCGVIWVLWLGTQVDWASVRRLLLRLHIPEGVVASLDHALLHGPSGAGKSSLLRLLAGLEAPAQGTLNRLGKRVTPDAALRDRLDGRVAFLDQNPERHFIASTVAEDIAWGLLRRGVDAVEAHRRAREVALALRIDRLLERPCYQLSFGEQRRVALASLLVLEPALLLLDEPTAGLDPVAAHELCLLVEEAVQRTGAACIWATHDLHSLPRQATRVVLLQERRLLFDGPTVQGLSKPWLVRAGLAVPEAGETTC